MTDQSDTNVTVFIDESQSEGLFFLVATIVPDRIRNQLTLEWESLQREIKRELLVDYPKAQSHFAEFPDELAEIHAVNMYTSAGYYRKSQNLVPPPNPTYFLKHFQWLEDAFSIQSRYTLPTLVIGGDENLRHPAHTHGVTMSDLITRHATPETLANVALPGMLARTDHLQALPYTWALPELLWHIENELKRRNWHGTIFCDEGNDQEGFRKAKLLTALLKAQAFKHVKGLAFGSGSRATATLPLEPLLQIPDIHAYVIRRHEAIRAGKRVASVYDRRYISWWAQYYTQRQLECDPGEMHPQQRDVSRMISYDFIVRHAGGPETLREALAKDIVSSLMRVAGWV
ncbi:MAG: hypothetical protein HC933_02090 [Pleurocapsa sp. SU_196_0]|nr:hypothetical protein [Pleurocapsa sp. SU_196_0]